MRSSRLSILALVVLLALANIAVTIRRSTIPLSLRGGVSDIQRRFEKHPGIDTVYLITVDGDTMQIDKELALRLDEGDGIEKRAWSTEMEVNGHRVTLDTSTDFDRMLVAMPILALVTLWLLFGRRHSSRREAASNRAP